MLEGALALAGVQPILYREDPYVGFAGNIPLFVEDSGSGLMVTAPNKLEWFNPQSFARTKPSGAFRIFSVGGSTTYGRPYDDDVSFSGWLRELLPRADPGRRWEVINAGGISYASYRVALLMEELARYDPDVFVIYTGHNEFLERRTYKEVIATPKALTGVAALLSRTRTYSAGARLLDALREKPAASPRGDAADLLPEEVDAILDHSIGPSQYHRDDELRRQVIVHFRFNLERMIDIARSVGAAVVLVTPASNLKDCSPFKSELSPDLSQTDAERFRRLLDQAREARRKGRVGEAAASLAKAVEIDPLYAEAQYRLGSALFEMGRGAEAKAAFARALANDVCPLRAPPEIQGIVSEVARERGATLVSFASDVERMFPSGLPGNDLFLDHVHLTADGYGLLAREILEAMAQRGLVSYREGWGEESFAEVAEIVEGRVDERSEGVALRNLSKVFHWAGKFDDAERLAKQANALLGEDAESDAILARRAELEGDFAEAVAKYRKAVELEPGFAEAHVSLGLALLSQGEAAEAVESLERALSLEPDNALAHGGLAEALSAKGRYQEAVPHYRKALAAGSEHAEPHAGLGVALLRLGDVEGGLAQLHRAVELEPDLASAQAKLGMALASAGRPAEALEPFRRVVRLEPDSAEAQNNLANALASVNELDVAVGRYRRALELEPGYVEAHRNLGHVLAARGDLEAARAHLTQALRLAPSQAETHLALAQVEIAAGNEHEGVRRLRDAVRLKPDWPLPLERLAWIMATSADSAIRDGAQAVQLAERAKRLTGGREPSVLNTLAASYAAVGDFVRAADAVEAALRLTPPEPLASDLRAGLASYRNVGAGIPAALELWHVFKARCLQSAVDIQGPGALHSHRER